MFLIKKIHMEIATSKLINFKIIKLNKHRKMQLRIQL